MSIRTSRPRIWLFAQAINLLCESGAWDYLPHRWRMRIWDRYFSKGRQPSAS